jgi:hypothetical protein
MLFNASARQIQSKPATGTGRTAGAVVRGMGDDQPESELHTPWLAGKKRPLKPTTIHYELLLGAGGS